MPTSLRIDRDGGQLILAGACTSASVERIRLDGLDCRGVEVIRIEAVDALDSVGLALIGALVARTAQGGAVRPVVQGRPTGVEDLCQAYRISADFSDFP